MSELTRYRRWMTVSIMYFLMICFLAAAFMPRVETIALGLALGTGISWINAFYLGYKVRKMSDDAAEGNEACEPGIFDKSGTRSARYIYRCAFRSISIHMRLQAVWSLRNFPY